MAFTIFEPNDCGRVDVASCSIDEGNSIITFAPRTETLIPDPGDAPETIWWWFYARVTGCAGRQPTLKIAKADKFEPQDSWCFSEDDGATWTRFSSVSSDETHYIYSHSAAFTADTVLIATFEPWTVEAQRTWIADLLENNDCVHPMRCAGGDGIVGFTGGTIVHGQSPTGSVVPQRPIYGLKITDQSIPRNNKYAVILSTFNHAGEHSGAWTFKAAVEWLAGESVDAVALRQIADFYLVPDLHPEGHLIGQSRSGVSETLNHNRNWIPDSDCPVEIRRVLDVLEAETSGQQIALVLDFHGNASQPNTGAGYALHTSAGDTARQTAFVNAILAIRADATSGVPGGTGTFPQSQRFIGGAIVAMSPETNTGISGTGGIVGVAAAGEWGEQLAQAIAAWLPTLAVDRPVGSLHRNSGLELGDTTNWVTLTSPTYSIVGGFVPGFSYALQVTGKGTATSSSHVGIYPAAADVILADYAKDLEISFDLTFNGVAGEGEAAFRLSFLSATSAGEWITTKIIRSGSDRLFQIYDGAAFQSIFALSPDTTYRMRFIFNGYGLAGCSRSIVVEDQSGEVVLAVHNVAYSWVGDETGLAVRRILFSCHAMPTSAIYKVAGLYVGRPRYGRRNDVYDLMSAQTVFPAEADVVAGTAAYGETGTEYNGTRPAGPAGVCPFFAG